MRTSLRVRTSICLATGHRDQGQRGLRRKRASARHGALACHDPGATSRSSSLPAHCPLPHLSNLISTWHSTSWLQEKTVKEWDTQNRQTSFPNRRLPRMHHGATATACVEVEACARGAGIGVMHVAWGHHGCKAHLTAVSQKCILASSRNRLWILSGF